MIQFIILIFYLTFFSTETLGGTIEGTIQFSRKYDIPEKYKIKKFKRICGSEIENESLIVTDNRLKNTVLFLSGNKLYSIKKPQKYILDQKQCRYEPHVMAIEKDSELKILASDPTNHNMHTYSFENDPINLMMNPGQDYVHQFEEAEVIKVECDLHKWMSAWIVVTDNPYFTISDKNGTFSISKVPTGKYKLTAWHETLGTIVKTINVKDDLTKIDFDFSNNSP